MARLELDDITVSRGGRRILDAVSLSIADGERLTLLGGSGAGKSTLVRAVAGSQALDGGVVRFDDRDVSGIPHPDRDVAMVIPGQGLLRHRDVAGNIGFPLEVQELTRDEIDDRVQAQARAFAIDGLLARRTSTLSAGELSEVVLARAFVRRPAIVAMDEPFARIDDRTRSGLLRDVIRMQEGYRATLLVATNDPHVATSIGQRTAVLHHGRLVQVGTATELLERPVSLEVFRLCTDGLVNVLPGRIVRSAGRTSLEVLSLRLPTWELALTDRAPGGVNVAILPADVRAVEAGDSATPHVTGRVVRHAFLGSVVDVTISTEDAQLTLSSPRPAPPIGSTVRVSLPLDRLHVFDAAGAAVSHLV